MNTLARAPIRRLRRTPTRTLPALWRALWSGLLRRRRATACDAAYAALAHLNEGTLRDIGAPDWVGARAAHATPWMLLERSRW